MMLRATRFHAALVMVALATIGTSAQSTIGGIVNDYAVVLEMRSCDSSVVVDQPGPFRAGDKVMIIQMKGATARAVNDSATTGLLIDIGNAGTMEFRNVERVEGSKITFTTNLVNSYETENLVQLVRVPTYAAAVVTSTLKAKPWDGKTGGVLSIWVDGILGMRSDIDGSASGYRGGMRSGFASECDRTEVFTVGADRAGGYKGETVVLDMNVGSRGPWVSGGGGGNALNAGGGGGGNGGVGGRGGDASTYCIKRPDVGGWGGYAVADQYGDHRFLMGGGGGGGHENRGNMEATDGGAGGGFVFIHAGALQSLGGSILSRGGTPSRASGWDGAGGGGAGGTIVIESDTILGSVTADVQGGKGGDVGYSPEQGTVYVAHGPGGGGGGGVVILNRPHSGITPVLLGGQPGTHIEPLNEAYMKSRNATAGMAGAVRYGFSWRTPKRFDFYVNGNGLICEGDTAVFTAAPGFVSYLWSNGDTTRSGRFTAAGETTITTIDSIGCVRVNNGPTVEFNTPKFTTNPTLDFGPCDMLRTYQRKHTIRNTDDEVVTISNLTVPAGFTLVDPTVFPLSIAPGGSYDITLSFTPSEDKEYVGMMHIDVDRPCRGEADVELKGSVTPIFVTFLVPDTTGKIGDEGFGIPIRVKLEPDSATMMNITFGIDVTVDSRMFKLDSVSNGTLIGDIIDNMTNLRTITLQFDSVSFAPGWNDLTRLFGRIMSAPVLTSPINIPVQRWIRQIQRPITTVDPGTLSADSSCYKEGRPIKLSAMPVLNIIANPSREPVVEVITSINGAYSVDILDVAGRKLQTIPVEPSNQIVTIPLRGLPSGSYVVRYSTPVNVLSARAIVE
ncbi:MAG: hypothetical protein FGM24_01780 [Candidatus Kapabacteria bacterium]|nr:hypothetical protein [Candidatus Kapabacteria bacterium]